MPGSARRRCKWCRWSWVVSESRFRSLGHASKHVVHMPCILVTVLLDSLCAGHTVAVFRASVGLLGRLHGVHDGICMCCGRGVRGSRCLRALVERERVPHALLDGAFVVGADVGVFGELVCVVVDGVGVSGGHGGRVCCCRDGCGSTGRIIGHLGVATKSFVFGPSVAATHPLPLPTPLG